MAYAALVTLSQLLDHTLHRHHKYFYVPRGDERRKLEFIHESSIFLQAFLDDHHSHKSSSVQSLEVKIRDAAYRAQDIIEWLISNHIETFYHECDPGVKKSCCQSLLSLITRKKKLHLDADLLEEAMDLFDLILQESINIRTSCSIEESSQITTAQTPALASSSKNEMVGYEEDLVAIQERLCGESTKLKIIPIVGMGGIGKTTLARNLFDDSLIAYHFHTRAWATVSQQHRPKEILLGILHSLTLKTEGEVRTSYLPERSSDESLKESVYRSLKGKRYLIVLDDMWSTETWDDLRMIFPDDNNGSRIIITTRLRNVAECASSSSPVHQMHLLNDDESWNLLQDKVFVEESCPPELEEIGKIVSKNCGGLPLAIVVIAGILTNVAMTHYGWKDVADNVSKAMSAADGNFSRILSLSYDHLPNHLKPCVLYMGAFPQDYEMPVSNLIMLWVAEGFLKPIESKTFEETAEEYLDDLVKRNLVMMTKKKWTDKFKCCIMHDLLRDLCIQKAHEELFLDVVDRNASSHERHSASTRRLAICFDVVDNVSNRYLFRSLWQFNFMWELSSLVTCSRLVRVIFMPKSWLLSFPDQITELFHLRYLAVFFHCNMGTEPLVLPSTISKLQNLQTLIIRRYGDMRSPVLLDIWKMPLLRHVLFKGCMLQIPPPSKKLVVLENLQSVSKLIDFKFTEKVVSNIPNMTELKLSYSSWAILGLKNIVHFNRVENLTLDLLNTNIVKAVNATNTSTITIPFHVHYGLPINIKKLSLKGCRPPSGGMSTIGSLPNLEVLKLKIFDFVDRCWETKEGEFTRLRFLRICWSNIINWRAESSHFPRLEYLIVKGCWVLEEIPCEIGDIATLKVMEVDKCSQTAADSALSIQEEQQSIGNEELVVTILTEFP